MITDSLKLEGFEPLDRALALFKEQCDEASRQISAAAIPLMEQWDEAVRQLSASFEALQAPATTMESLVLDRDRLIFATQEPLVFDPPWLRQDPPAPPKEPIGFRRR